jgi:hypothetical protein
MVTGATTANRPQADIRSAGGARKRASATRSRAFSRIAARGEAGMGAASDMLML